MASGTRQFGRESLAGSGTIKAFGAVTIGPEHGPIMMVDNGTFSSTHPKPFLAQPQVDGEMEDAIAEFVRDASLH